VTGGDPGPDFGTLVGDPATFDPEQVYVRGTFEAAPGTLNTTTPYGSSSPCSDVATGIADWSSPSNDWTTDFGLTIALPCEIDDVRIRVDGSIIYEHLERGINLMVEEGASADPGSAVVIVDMKGKARPNENDVSMAGCYPGPEFPLFRFSVHPEKGTFVYVCEPPQMDPPVTDAPAFVHFEGVGDNRAEDILFPVPEGYIAAHLGYDDYVLVHNPDDPDDMGILSGATDVVPVAIASEFAFVEIQAVRATPDGFLLLIMRNPDPPELELWSLSYQGELAQVGVSASGAEVALNESNCPDRRGGGFGTDIINKLPRAGCMCALEPDGTALCLAREGAGDEIVVRFDFSESSAPPTTVYRVADDPYLQSFVGLVTGS
jgi:hypothetical protein